MANLSGPARDSIVPQMESLSLALAVGAAARTTIMHLLRSVGPRDTQRRPRLGAIGKEAGSSVAVEELSGVHFMIVLCRARSLLYRQV